LLILIISKVSSTPVETNRDILSNVLWQHLFYLEMWYSRSACIQKCFRYRCFTYNCNNAFLEIKNFSEARKFVGHSSL